MNNLNNENTKEKEHIALYAMKLEYSLLSKEEKVKYMNLLTEWYMREKDTLRNSY